MSEAKYVVFDIVDGEYEQASIPLEAKEAAIAFLKGRGEASELFERIDLSEETK